MAPFDTTGLMRLPPSPGDAQRDMAELISLKPKEIYTSDNPLGLSMRRATPQGTEYRAALDAKIAANKGMTYRQLLKDVQAGLVPMDAAISYLKGTSSSPYRGEPEPIPAPIPAPTPAPTPPQTAHLESALNTPLVLSTPVQDAGEAVRPSPAMGQRVTPSPAMGQRVTPSPAMGQTVHPSPEQGQRVTPGNLGKTPLGIPGKTPQFDTSGLTPFLDTSGLRMMDQPEGLTEAGEALKAAHIRVGQHVIEGVKGVIPGAVQLGGLVVKGVSAGVVDQQRYEFKLADTLRHATSMTPEDLQKVRMEVVRRLPTGRMATFMVALAGVLNGDDPEAAITQHYPDTVGVEPPTVAESAPYKTGEAITDYGRGLFPAEPGFEQGIGRQLGEGLGSVVAGATLSFVPGAGPYLALSAFTFAGSGEAVERAVQAGATEDQIIESAKLGTFPGMTDSIPVEVLLGRIPLPGGKLIKIGSEQLGMALKFLGRIGWQAFVEGIQEGGQAWLQNMIAREVYDPEQSLTEGVLPEAGVGAGVGGIAGALIPGRDRSAGAPEAAAPPVEPAAEPLDTSGLIELPTEEQEIEQARAEIIEEGAAVLAGEPPSAPVAEQAVEAPPPEVLPGPPGAPETFEATWDRLQEERKVAAGPTKQALDLGTESSFTYEENRRSMALAKEVGREDIAGFIAERARRWAETAAQYPAVAEEAQRFSDEMAAAAAVQGGGTGASPVKAETAAEVDVAAQQAETEPSEAQKEAGNYKKGHVLFKGIGISIENPIGSTRSGVDPDGKKWSVPMRAHYGYAKRTEGADGEQVDVYIGLDTASDMAYIVDQIDPRTGKFDEHKVILAASNMDDAMFVYDVHFSDNSGPTRRANISEITIDEFKEWLKTGNNKKPYAEIAPPPAPEPVPEPVPLPEAPVVPPAEVVPPEPPQAVPEPVPEPVAETIVATAMQDPTGQVFSGITHVDAAVEGASEFGQTVEDFTETAQEGFLTSTGRFVRREEAQRIAAQTKQTLRPGDLELDSSDLAAAAEPQNLVAEAWRTLTRRGRENIARAAGFDTKAAMTIGKTDYNHLDTAIEEVLERHLQAKAQPEPEPVDIPEPISEPVAEPEPISEPVAPPPTQPEPKPEPIPQPEPGPEPEPAIPTPAPEPTKPRLLDVGEKMAGKRADEVDRFEKGRTGSYEKDVNRVLDRSARATAWKVELPSTATPGTGLYLQAVRSKFDTLIEIVGKSLGAGRRRWQSSFKEAIIEHVKSPETLKELEGVAADYIAFMETLKEATDGATTIQQATTALDKLFHKEPDGTGGGDLTDFGETAKGYSSKSWRFRYLVKNLPGTFTDDQTVGDRAKPMRRPSLKQIIREDMKDHRDGKDASGDDLIKTFGFRGVEFGNWVNSAERQAAVNHAFDALHDLVDTLDIPAKAVSLGGRLGLALGSRGRGRHAAHYEPGNVVINLTKTKGDGSVSHEWGHAFDYALRETPFGQKIATAITNSLIRRWDLEGAKRTLDSFLQGKSWYEGSKRAGPIVNAQNYLRRIQRDSSARPSTKFKREGDKLGKKYWGSSVELWARAFESFVFDEMIGSSPFLVTDWVEEGKVGKASGYKGQPYPAGDERKDFAETFRDLFANIVWSEDGTPTVKEGYESLEDKRSVEIKEYFDKIDLDARQRALAAGNASPLDGHWWYAFRKEGRGTGRQPKGHVAYNDALSGRGVFTKKGGIAYDRPLTVEEMEEFGLGKITLKEDGSYGGKFVYLDQEGGDGGRGPGTEPDGTPAVGPPGEEALGEAPAEDGGAPEAPGRVPGRPRARPGAGGEEVGPTGEGRPGRPSGPVGGEAGVSPPAGGGREGGAGQRPDAFQPTGTNYRITLADEIGQGGLVQKFRDNVEAIETLKKVEAEKRFATPAEQKILVKYVGWGGMPQAFDSWRASDDRQGWYDRANKLKEVLSNEEWRTAKTSTINAHYTSPAIISAMWDAVGRLGFEGGRVLEPATGVGHFFGLMPDAIAGRSKLTGVELDSISARLTKQLYQQAAIHEKGYEETPLPERFFDLVISNVPFADVKPHDRKYNKERLNLHDYYFRKSIEMTRPGGIVAFITTKGTMDKAGTKARKLLAEKVDLIGAIRLPQDAFKGNANTTVTTDIIFLRRKVEGEEFEGQPWTDLTTAPMISQYREATEQPLNEYYVANPEMMLGEMIVRRNRYGQGWETALDAKPEANIENDLREAIDRLPENVMADHAEALETEQFAAAIPAEGEAQDGGYLVRGGKLYVRVGTLDVPADAAIEKRHGKVIRDFIGLRDIARKVIRLQLQDSTDQEVTAARKELNKLYDAFVKKNGFVTPLIAKSKFEDDPDAARLYALENWNPDTLKATKADIFTKNTVDKQKAIDKADNVEDALAISLNDRGRVDWPRISSLTGMSAANAKAELEGLVFDDPESGWVTADAYLSGNVRDKLRVAEAAAKTDPVYATNVEALKAVQPEDLEPSQIKARLGAPWIPGSDVSAFAAELMNANIRNFKVRFSSALGLWAVDYGGDSQAAKTRMKNAMKSRTEATTEWGTARAPFPDLLEHTLNGTFPRVMDKDFEGRSYVNIKETEAAREKLRSIKNRFAEWLWEDGDRAKRLLRKYNDEQNNIRLRKYDGSHLTFPGMAADITMGQHQKDAVWRILQSGNTYLGHEVGTGKTFTMVAAAMEARRLGIARKPMIAVLKSTMEGFLAEAQRLYPGAKILSVTITNNPAQRKRQMARIATNDWDLVLVTHESFNRIPVSGEAMKDAFLEELDILEAVLAEEQAASGKKSTMTKQLEKAKLALLSKLKELEAKVKKDPGTVFEELGTDMVHIDEAQQFKNLQFHTKLARDVRGLTPAGSGRAFDLYVKSKHLNGSNGTLVLASGTPLSNSVGELFSISRFLQPEALADRDIRHFDMWVNTFGETDQVTEYSPEGGGYRMVTKIARFVNVPELMQMVYSVLDPISAENAGIKRPPIKGGEPEAVLVPQNAAVSAFQTDLEARAKFIRQNPKAAKEHGDNMLVVTMDGRKAAIDMRLVDQQEYEDDPDTKINYVVERVYDIWGETKAWKGAQIVFADLGAPGVAGKFNVYSEIKRKLIEKGVPEKEVAFIHDAKNDRQRKALFAKVRDGSVRVFIGSTQKAGTGVNVQTRIAAMHHLDIWWNIASYLQRNGRGQRQGNIVFDDYGWKLRILNYATEGTVDAFMWDKVQYKAKVFDQFLSGNVTQREIEDISQDAVSAAEMVAITSGDPLVAEKVELEHRTGQLASLKGSFDDQRRRLKWTVDSAPERIAGHEQTLVHLEADLTAADDQTEVKIRQGTYKLDDKKAMKEAAELFKDELASATKSREIADGYYTQPRVVATIVGPKGRVAVMLRNGLGGTYVEAHGPNKNHNLGARTLAGVLTSYKGEVQRHIDYEQGQINGIKEELPKQKAAVAKPFEHLDEFNTKSARLSEINDILLKREQDPTPANAPVATGKGEFRVASIAGEYVAISRFEVVFFDELPNVEFFTFKKEDEWWLVHTDTGVRATISTVGAAEATETLQKLIDEKGAEYVANAIAKVNTLSDEDRMEAEVKGAVKGPKFSQRPVQRPVSGASRTAAEADRGHIARALQARLKRLGIADKVTLRVVADLSAVIAGRRITVEGLFRPEGLEVIGKRGPIPQFRFTPALIEVSLAVQDGQWVLSHEVIHALREYGLIGAAEWTALSKTAKFDTKRMAAMREQRKGHGWTEEQIVEEVVADMFADWSVGRTQVGGAIKRAFRRVRDFFVALRQTLTGAGYNTVEDIYGAIEKGEVGRRKRIAPARRQEPKLSIGTKQQQETIDRIMDRPGKEPLRERLSKIVTAFKDELTNRLTQHVLDQFDSIKRLEKAATGKIARASHSAYKAARMSQNLHSVMGAVLRHGPLEFKDGAFQVKKGFEGGFEAIFQDIADRGELDLWSGYAIANRAKRLMREDREHLLTKEDIAVLLNQEPERKARFDKALAKWAEFNKAMLDMAEETGLIDGDNRALWENEDYVPFYRVLEDSFTKGPFGKRGLAGQRAGIRRLKGGEQKIGDLIQNMVMNMTHLVDASMKNEAARRTVELLEQNDMMDGILEPVGQDWAKVAIAPSQAIKALKEIGVATTKMSKRQRESWLKLFTMKPPMDPDVISVMVEGKPRYFRVLDPMLLSSLTSLGSERIHWLMKALGAPKRILTVSITSFPGFMVRNLFRDSLHNWVISGEKFKPGLDSMRGFVKSLREDKELVSIMAAGGGSGGFYRTDPEDVKKMLHASRLESGSKGVIIDTPRAAWEWWRRIGQATENANRIALYEAVLKDTGDKAEAAFQAMDIMDFSMRGDAALVRFLIGTVPFMNARMQGLYRLGRGAHDNPKTFFLRGAIIAGITLALMASNDGDDRYDDLPEWERDFYYHIFLDNIFPKAALEAAGIDVSGWHIKLPKPFEVGAVFSTVPERFYRWIRGQDDGEVLVKRIGAMFRDTFALDMPQFIKPLIEQAANRIYFIDAPIVPERLKKLQPEAQFTGRTSKLARVMAEAMPDFAPDSSRSPKRIEALARGYLGTLGTYIMSAGDAAITPFFGDPERPAMRADRIPELGSFIRQEPLYSTRWVTEFYEIKREIETLHNTYSAYRKSGDFERAKQIVAESPIELRLMKHMRRVGTQMAKINRTIRSIETSRTMSADDKRTRIDALYKIRADLAKKIVKSVNKVLD